MEFIVNTIISGIMYDLIKKGIALSVSEVCKNINTIFNDYNIIEEKINIINSKQTTIEKNEYIKSLENDSKYILTLKKAYPTVFSSQIDYILFLMNNKYANNDIKFTLASICEFLNFSSVNELKKFYHQNEEPEFSFIESIAAQLGVNPIWLKSNINTPYIHQCSFNRDEMLYFDLNAIKEVYFLTTDIKNDFVTAVFKYNNYKYMYTSYQYPLNHSVGATGANDKKALKKFIDKIDTMNKYGGFYSLPEDIYNKLLCGKEYPGVFLYYDHMNTYKVEELLEKNI